MNLDQLTPGNLSVILVLAIVVYKLVDRIPPFRNGNGSGKRESVEVKCPGMCKLGQVDHDALVETRNDVKSVKNVVDILGMDVHRYVNLVLSAPLDRFECKAKKDEEKS